MMKLLFVFCCLTASFVIWTEASPLFFNLQRTYVVPQRTAQIRSRPVAPRVPQRIDDVGFRSFFSRYFIFPGITVTKQFGTRRPTPTQRPVIEVNTTFEPTDQDIEDGSSSEVPAETIDSFTEEIFSTMKTTTTEAAKPTSATTQVEKSTTTTKVAKTTTTTSTTTTTTAVPFEEIEPFTESKTSTTTTELPFEETEPGSKPSSTFSSTSTSTSTTTELPLEEIGFTTEKVTTSVTSFVTKPTTTYQPESSSNVPEVTKPSTGYLPSGTIEPTTYRPTFTTTTSTYVPVEETADNTIPTGEWVDPNDIPEPYNYGRPEISVKDILSQVAAESSPGLSVEEVLNEVSAKARPFEALVEVGNLPGATVYRPDLNMNVDRPQVTFYTNYY